MAKLITVYWRDIPSQVIAKKGRTKSKVQLSQRFQEAIDRAAMRAGKGSSDAYLSEWRREATTCSDNLDEAVRKTADSLENQYSDDDLLILIRAKGVGLETS
ncbi:MAG: virulence factor [Pseudomonadota bacterium]|nr:virulence factor [Pseudomonadota bacterium]MEE3288806.1 virulence factor [Pseudomonadota bacterium]